MNPLFWPHNHKVAMLIFICISFLAGNIIGYILYALPSGVDGSVSYRFWFYHPIRYDGFWWTLGGGVVGGSAYYARRLAAM